MTKEFSGNPKLEGTMTQKGDAAFRRLIVEEEISGDKTLEQRLTELQNSLTQETDSDKIAVLNRQIDIVQDEIAKREKV